MTDFKHLSQPELLGYSQGSLKKSEMDEIGNHLLFCPKCRERLPMPSVERFWSIIMMDEETIEIKGKEESEVSSVFSFSKNMPFLRFQTGLLWSGGLLIIIFCFSFLLWLNLEDSTRELAGKFENEGVAETKFELPRATPTAENRRASTPAKPDVVKPDSKVAKPDVTKKKIGQNSLNLKKSEGNPSPKPEKFSTTRGVSGNCQEEKSIGLEFSSNQENFVFKWKKVPKAVKYHLYISDDEEILIDEFETQDETTFILKKPLDPLKTYKWKIIVSLEDGNKVIGANLSSEAGETKEC
jgi:hypothetical protein